MDCLWSLPLSLRGSFWVWFFFFHHASGLVVALFFQEEEVAAYLPPTPLAAFCSHFPSVQDLLKLYTVESN